MKLGLSDNDEDETDAADVEREDEGHCHPLCQCNKCTGRQRVCDILLLSYDTFQQ